MALMRVGTLKGEVVIDDGKGEVKLSKVEVDSRKGSDEQVKGEMESKAGRSIDIPLYFRKHKDTGRMMVATGVEPEEWPDGSKGKK